MPLAGTQPTSAPPVTPGLANVTAALVPQVMFVENAGQMRAMGTAGICSNTTLNEQVLVPQTLVAVQVTRFVPKGNTLPLAGAHSTSAPLETAGLANATTASVPQVVFVKDAGQASVTAGICLTVTLKEQVLEPQTLVAVQVTRFVPKGNTLPLAGTQPTSAPSLTMGPG